MWSGQRLNNIVTVTRKEELELELEMAQLSIVTSRFPITIYLKFLSIC